MKAVYSYFEKKITLGNIIILVGIIVTVAIQLNNVEVNAKDNRSQDLKIEAQDLKIEAVDSRVDEHDRKIDVIINMLQNQKETLNEIKTDVKEIKKAR